MPPLMTKEVETAALLLLLFYYFGLIFDTIILFPKRKYLKKITYEKKVPIRKKKYKEKKIYYLSIKIFSSYAKKNIIRKINFRFI